MKRDAFYAEARSDDRGPLNGIRVLEATTTWAGPMCGCVLADFGADVIKVEHPDGEMARRAPPYLPDTNPPLSFMQVTVNRNKRSLGLDLRQPEGRDLFLDLAARSDVVVENFRPGTMDRWGVGYGNVRERKPDIVYVSISGYGQFGPDSERVGYDPLAQAASGFLSLNGEPDGMPVKSPTFLADDLAGLHSALAALAALRHRDQVGEGQYIDVSLLDCMLFQSTGYLTLGALDVPLPRLGNEFRIAAPANVFPCRNGHVAAGVLLDSHWKRLATLIGRAELADDPHYATIPERVSRRAEVNALLTEWTQPQDVEAIVERFAEAGIPAAPVRTYHQAARDPHIRARDMLQDTLQEDGSQAPITGPASKFSRTPTRVRTGAPGLGQHSDEILDELGVGEERKRALRDSRVLV